MLRKIRLSPEDFKEFIFAGVALVFFIVYFGLSGARPPDLLQFKVICVSIGMLLLVFLILYAIIRSAFRGMDRAVTIKINVGRLIGFSVAYTVSFYAAVYLYILIVGSVSRDLYTMVGGVVAIICNVCIVHLLYLWLTLFAYALGLRATRRIGLELDRAMGFFVTLGIGLYMLILLYFILSLLHILSIAPIILAVLTLYFIWMDRLRLQSLLLKIHTVTLSSQIGDARALWYTVGLLAVLFGPLLLFRYYTYPSLSLDDWQTYLNVPLTFLTNGGYTQFISPVNQISFASTYLILPIAQLYRPAIAILNSYLFLLTTAVLACIAVSRLKPRAAFWSCILLTILLMNDFMLYSVRPDALLLLFTTVALALVLTVSHERSSRSFAVAGFFVGSAFAVKYSALLLIPALIVLLLFQSDTIKQKVRGIVIMCFFAAIAFAPWGIYNMLRYGSPMYPFLSISQQAAAPSSQAFAAVKKNYYAELQSLNYLTVHIDQSGLTQLLMPSLVTRSWPVDYLGPIVLLIGAAALLKKRNAFVVQLALAATASYLAWHFMQVSWLHYLYFLFPLLVLMLAYYLDQLKYSGLAYLVLLLLLIAYVQTLHTGTVRNATLMLANDQQYLAGQHNLEGFKVAQTIDALKRQDSNYVLFNIAANDNYPFYPAIDGNAQHIYVNNYLDDHDWFDYAMRYSTTDSLITALQQNGMTHIAVPTLLPFTSEIRRSPDAYPVFSYLNYRLAEVLQKLPLVSSSPYIQIYQIPSSR